MYIGPWQEYKLARLIQHHQEQQSPSVPRRPSSQPRRHLVVSRRKNSEGQLDDTASVTSSTRSGISFNSTQSAPAQLPGQPSAQSRLNDFYQHYERTTKHDAAHTPMSKAGARLPPRPRSSTGGQPAAKRKAKAKAGPSFEEERRARIQHMKRLYGLAEPEPSTDTRSFQATSCDLNETACLGRVESTASLTRLDGYSGGHRIASPTPPPLVIDKESFTPDFDRALHELQASMDNHEEPHRLASPEPFARQDPMALSMSADSMGGSGGLIAWSKNLRPEDLSTDVTLASFL